MKKRNTTRFRLNPKKPPKTDWRAFDAMSEKDRHRAAASDADAQPATAAQLARARRVPTVRALRQEAEADAGTVRRPLSLARSGPCGTGSRARTVPTRRRRCC